MKITTGTNKKMNGLIKKDLLQLKSYEKTLISFIIIFILLSILQLLISNNSGLLSILSIIITLGFGMFSIVSFNYDELAKSDKYISTLPVTKEEIIQSKYYFIISANVIGLFISIPINILLYILLIDKIMVDTNVLEFLNITFGGLLGIGILEAIQIPCIYKYGAEKAKMQIFMIGIIIIVLGMILIGAICYWFELLLIDIETLSILFPFASILLIIIVYYMSYKFSCKIYSKKEF